MSSTVSLNHTIDTKTAYRLYSLLVGGFSKPTPKGWTLRSSYVFSEILQF